MPTHLARIKESTAAEVCANFDLDEGAKRLLRDGMSPQEFVDVLIQKESYVDAIEFLAHALPVREGIWWGGLCMQHALGENLSAADKVAAAAALWWLIEPGETNRLAAAAPAESADPLSPAGALALAASQTANAPPFASARAIARAVKLASLRKESVGIAKLQRAYVGLGLVVAEGQVI